MAVPTTTHRLTADEYFALDLPERRAELINGEIVVNDPTVRHVRISGALFVELTAWCRGEPGRGEAFIAGDVHLDEHNVYKPDVWWVAEGSRPGREAARMVGPPHLGVEVRSPSTWRYDVGVKRSVYEATGLAELWLVDTKADTVLVFRRSSPKSTVFDVNLELGGGQQLTTPLLPGLSIDLEELFDR